MPTSTYRLRLGPDLPFCAAEEYVPYLASLGVSHLHLPLILEGASGSGGASGEDHATDHRRVREDLGGEAGLRRLAGTARHHGLGLVADLAPGQMAIPTPLSPGDPLWDVLLHGPGSRYAEWFDIDWAAGGGRVLLPVLAGPVGEEWRSCSVADGMLHYGEMRFPLRPGTGRTPLPDLLDHQHYRLAWWRLGRTELNYRRFLTSDDLIAVRTEDPEVFDATHETMVRLAQDGVLEGLHVLHPDDLADPAGYFHRLAERSGGVWTVAGKTLGQGEQLPADWQVDGTTGYDALRHIDAVLTDDRGCAALTEVYRARTGAPPDLGGDWETTTRRAAYRTLSHDLSAEVARLQRTAEAACREVPGQRLRDLAPWALSQAVIEVLAALPVHRPYVPAGGPPGPVDEAVLARAADSARAAFAVEREAQAVHTVRELALGRLGGGAAAEDFRVRFAQTAAAVRAVCVEGTAGHRYTPLPAACETGGAPDEPSLVPSAFHAYCGRVQRDWPTGGTVLTGAATHRSADARAVLRALAEDPEGWARLLPHLTEATAREGARAPDPHLAWTVWQAALALGGEDAEHLLAAAVSDARRAALHTTGTEPNAAYERALARFVRAGPGGPAAELLTAFAGEIAPQIRAQTLGAALIHLTMPGVPDLHAGSETRYVTLGEHTRPVRPPLPTTELRALDGGAEPSGLAAEKLRLTAVVLRLRRSHPQWFGPRGGYQELAASGPAAAYCLAYTRAGRAVTAVTRLTRRLEESGGWRGTSLPLPEGAGVWRELLTGRQWAGPVAAAELFATAPVALLVREPGG